MDPVTPPTPYAAPWSIRGVRVVDIMTLLTFALMTYMSIRNGTPLPPVPVPVAVGAVGAPCNCR